MNKYQKALDNLAKFVLNDGGTIYQDEAEWSIKTLQELIDKNNKEEHHYDVLSALRGALEREE